MHQASKNRARELSSQRAGKHGSFAVETRRDEPSRRASESMVCRDGARRNQAALEISEDALSDKAIQGLVDDWIVLMIVDQLIEKLGLR